MVGEGADVAQRFRTVQISQAQISFPQIPMPALGKGIHLRRCLQHGIQFSYPCLAVGFCGWAHN